MPKEKTYAVLNAARELAGYVRGNAHKHITEVKLIEAIDAFDAEIAKAEKSIDETRARVAAYKASR